LKTPDLLAAILVLAGLVATATHLLHEEDEVVSGFATVVDGDSLRLDHVEIRISGIDAPELRQTCSAAGRTYPCGDVAKKALLDMLAGRVVTCRLSGHDRFGRHLASCETGGADIGAALVGRGFALAYGRYQREEAAAQRQKLQLWAGSFERPSEWRKTHSGQDRS
jgi:endonuclease YncB( thermonuclease family)